MTGRSRDAATRVWQRELWVAAAGNEHIRRPVSIAEPSGVEQRLKEGRWRAYRVGNRARPTYGGKTSSLALLVHVFQPSFHAIHGLFAFVYLP